MATASIGQISFAFHSLQELGDLLAKDGGSEIESHLFRLVDQLDGLAIPLLFRRLREAGPKGRLAQLLLYRLSQDATLKRRILRCIDSELEKDECASHVLLLDLQQHLCPDAPTIDPAPTKAQLSFVELASSMRSQADVAMVADALLGDFPPAELIEFLEDLAIHQPEAASTLCAELRLHDELDNYERKLLANFVAEHNLASRELELEFPKKCTRKLAARADGAHSYVAYSRVIEAGPRRYRCLRLDLCPNMGLVAAEYFDDICRSEIDRRILGLLREEGFSLTPVPLGHARSQLITAMRIRRRLGESMPEDYYLGRDLFSLSDEHLTDSARASRRKSDQLASGTRLLRQGKLPMAQQHLTSYLVGHEDSTEALASMAECLWKQGDFRRARTHIERACWLRPSHGPYHWRRATMARQEGRFADCFHALADYLRCTESVDRAKQREASEILEHQSQFSPKPVSNSAPSPRSNYALVREHSRQR